LFLTRDLTAEACNKQLKQFHLIRRIKYFSSNQSG
jgi:hypothetical protein